MAGVNKVILIGNLGADPEIKEFSNGGKVARLRLAVSEKWKDRDGNPQEQTEWFTLECWEKLAGIAERFLSKGSKIYVEGKLKTDRWQDNEGNERTAQKVRVLSLQMLGEKRSQATPAQQIQSGAIFASGADDDDLPF